MVKKVSLGCLLSSFVGMEYKLGDVGCNTGTDCVGLIHEYVLRRTGIKLGLVHNKIDYSGYTAVYNHDKEATMSRFKKVLDHVFPIRIPSEETIGDIVFSSIKVCSSTNTKAVGINAGNGMMLVVSEIYGVRVVPMSGYEIIRSYICQPLSR